MKSWITAQLEAQQVEPSSSLKKSLPLHPNPLDGLDPVYCNRRSSTGKSNAWTGYETVCAGRIHSFIQPAMISLAGTCSWASIMPANSTNVICLPHGSIDKGITQSPQDWLLRNYHQAMDNPSSLVSVFQYAMFAICALFSLCSCSFSSRNTETSVSSVSFTTHRRYQVSRHMFIS